MMATKQIRPAPGAFGRTTAWRIAGALVLLLPAGCGSATAPGAQDEPPGGDTTTPFPIDRGDEAGTPGTYKGLWLRLTDNGAPAVTAVDGLIGLVCIGMSNARQECNALQANVRGAWAAEVSPAVRVVNCAVGGHAIERWIDPSFDDVLWDDCITRKVPQAGLRADQVRVVYHKAANQFTTGAGGSALPLYPDPGSDFAAFRSHLTAFAARVRVEMPFVQAVYTSSRSYGGFANNPGRGEPLSYEEGHALNAWLADNARVDGVWYGWGAYLWAPACGSAEGRNGTGMCYERADYVSDGVHPSPTGEARIARAMHERLRAESWYRR